MPVELRSQAELAGATVVDRSSVITTHLAEVVRGTPPACSAARTSRCSPRWYDAPTRRSIEELTPALLSLGEVQRVLQALLDEQVSIRDLVRIFEALSLRARASKDLDGLVEAARETLGPAVVAPYVQDGSVHVISLEPGLEQRLLEGLRVGEAGGFLVLDADLSQGIVTETMNLARFAEEQNLNPVLVCAPQIRAAVRRMMSPTMPGLPVIGYGELTGPTQIRSVGVVGGAPRRDGVRLVTSRRPAPHQNRVEGVCP